MSEERGRIVARLAEIDEQRDDVLLRLAALAVRGGPVYWARLEALGPGMAERAAWLLARELGATVAEAEATTINAATPRMWIATGCGHQVRAVAPRELCDVCAA